jgi:hypothetical protein
VTFKSDIGDTGPTSRYQAGQRVRVLYDPAGIIAPVLDSWAGLWYAIATQFAAGVVFIGAAAVIWVAFGDRILGDN